MSHTTVNVHNVVTATARIQRRDSSEWLTLEFTDKHGATFDLTVFPSDGTTPEALLARLIGSRVAESEEA